MHKRFSPLCKGDTRMSRTAQHKGLKLNKKKKIQFLAFILFQSHRNDQTLLTQSVLLTQVHLDEMCQKAHYLRLFDRRYYFRYSGLTLKA